MSDTVRVTVRRFDPAVDKQPYEQVYEVSVGATESVTNILYDINERHGAAIAYRVSCHRGICASCRMKINGKARLGCTYEVGGGSDVRVEPPTTTGLIKDLVIESDWKGLGAPEEAD